jgi:hypothetical protein
MPMTAVTDWTPAPTISRDDIVHASEEVLALPDRPYTEREDVFRVEALGLQWDIGVHVYEPADPAAIAVGGDGKKIGGFLLHGGQDDWRQVEPLARLLTGKFGWKTVAGTFPGRLYLPDPSRNWPGDTLNPDGTARTPIWLDGEYVTPDQYDIVKDAGNRARDGVRTLARAKPGSQFYYRMAAWPAAMEAGMVEANRRHFPVDEYSIYFQGHSTGGPMVSMLCQRVPNCAGVLAAENSPFGVVNGRKHTWGGTLGKIGSYERTATKAPAKSDPFNELYLRTWRDLARYRGPEALGREGPQALMRLPWLMEEILAEWAQQTERPRFKCEYPITHNIRPSLIAAAEVSARRLGLDEDGTRALVEQFVGYTEPLTGPDVMPVPPFLFGISKDSRDHSPEVYAEVIMPLFAAMTPPPKIALTRFMAGVHMIWTPEQDLPMGITPAVVQQWHDAIVNGWFVVPAA